MAWRSVEDYSKSMDHAGCLSRQAQPGAASILVPTTTWALQHQTPSAPLKFWILWISMAGPCAPPLLRLVSISKPSFACWTFRLNQSRNKAVNAGQPHHVSLFACFAPRPSKCKDPWCERRVVVFWVYHSASSQLVFSSFHFLRPPAEAADALPAATNRIATLDVWRKPAKDSPRPHSLCWAPCRAQFWSWEKLERMGATMVS